MLRGCSLGVGVDAVPIVLHIDNGPALFPGLVEPLVEAADVRVPVVGPLALRIGVVDVEAEAEPVPGLGPLVHLEITIRIAG